MKLKMIRVSYVFPLQMIMRLKKAHERTGLTVSEIIRRAVDKYLEGMGL
jgi:predicted DNA-binding protein